MTQSITSRYQEVPEVFKNPPLVFVALVVSLFALSGMIAMMVDPTVGAYGLMLLPYVLFFGAISTAILVWFVIVLREFVQQKKEEYRAAVVEEVKAELMTDV